MGNYMYDTNGVQRNELEGGTGVATEIWNIEVGENAEIKRGDLLCASSPSGVFSLVSSAGDANKVLAIASTDFIAGASATVTQGYVAGIFNREKINLGDGLTLAPFENELRKQNIHLTSLKEGI